MLLCADHGSSLCRDADWERGQAKTASILSWQAGEEVFEGANH